MRTLLLGSVAVALALACGKGGDKGDDTAKAGDDTAAKSADNAGETTNHPLPGDPAAGEAVYKRICLACHGADGRGNGGITGADFIGDKTRLAKSNEQLITSVSEGVSTGKVPMPPQKGVLSEQEIKDALSYVRQQFGNK